MSQLTRSSIALGLSLVAISRPVIADGVQHGAASDQPTPAETAPPPTAPEATAPPPAEPPPAPAAPAPDAVTQGVQGVVIDTSTELGMAGATITVLEGGTGSATTDLEGHYQLALAPGRYIIHYFSPLYGEERRRVRVENNAIATEDVQLSPDEGATEVIEISSKIDTRSASAALAVRRAAPVLSDAISAQDIAKSPDSSASEAVKRVVSVSVLDGKYVALRGLEGRYVSTLLNGIVLPSPEPDRNAVPLDLFPTKLLANLTVFKSYSANLPGQFGGGTLSIETNSYPDELEVKISASSSANTVSTAQSGLTNASATGGASFFGFDAGQRALPGSISRTEAVRGSAAQTEAAGEAFANHWSATDQTVSPNLSFAATVGNTHKLAGRDLGYLATATFKRSLALQSGTALRLAGTDQGLRATNDLRFDQGVTTSTLGALLNTGYELSKDDQLDLLALYTHVGTDTTGKVAGYVEADSSDIDSTHLEFVARSLAFSQLRLTHSIGDTTEIKIQANAANTVRDELDTRDLTYDLDAASGMRRYVNQPGSGQRYFSYLDESSLGTGADLSYTDAPVRLAAGASIQRTNRTLDGRRFRYRFTGQDTSVLGLDPEAMFSKDNIGTQFRFQEETLQEDSYSADQAIAAGYVSGEVQATDTFRAILGMRFEYATQHLADGAITAVGGATATADRTDTDFLPAMNGVWAVSPTANVRAAYSYTLTRPRFRELAPFLFFDYVRRRAISGNTELETTHIHNADLRWEWFPEDGEVVAVSGFYKHFEKPIEQVFSNSESDATFRNADAGDLAGVEFEVRTSLGRLSDTLDRFKVAGNLALMSSSVQLPATAMLNTSQDRPLYGQSPYVLNLSVEFADPKLINLGVLYNVSGARIDDVGILGLPDVYEQPLHRVDVVASRALSKQLNLKLSMDNVFFQKPTLQAANFTVRTYDPGSTVALSLDWTP